VRPDVPRRPVYVFYGDQVGALQQARDRTLNLLLDPEFRAENLIEYTPPANRFGVELMKLLPELAAELDTVSFIPGAPKVALVHNPTELYASGAGFGKPPSRRRRGSARAAAETPTADEASEAPAAASGALAWLRQRLPASGNHLIVIALEDEAEGREVNDRHPLMELFAGIGHVQPFRDKKAFWRLEEAILNRDAAGCLAAIDDLWKPGKGDQSVYSGVARCFRFMLQAGIAREKRLGEASLQIDRYLPGPSNLSLARASDFVRRKYISRPAPYRATALLEAYLKLLEVYRALRPRPSDLYVPEARALLERLLLELMASPRPGSR